MKKYIPVIMVLGIVVNISPAEAFYTNNRHMIYTPVITEYSCTIENSKCKVTEISYLENGRNYYKSVCTGDNMSESHNESLVRSDVERKRRQYCSPKL